MRQSIFIIVAAAVGALIGYAGSFLAINSAKAFFLMFPGVKGADFWIVFAGGHGWDWFWYYRPLEMTIVLSAIMAIIFAFFAFAASQ